MAPAWRQRYLFHQADAKRALLSHLQAGKVKGQRSMLFFIQTKLYELDIIYKAS